jgi:hypothetical protein
MEPPPAPEPKEWRSFEDAILHASRKEAEGDSERVCTLLLAEKFDRRPVGFSVKGHEKNALVTRAVYEELPDKPFLAMVNKSAKSKGLLEIQPCLN